MAKRTTPDEQAAYDRCHRRTGCEGKVAPDCRYRNEVAHHRRLRSQGGPTTDDNLVALCTPCHLWVHAHWDFAVELGLIVPSWAAIEPFVRGTPARPLHEVKAERAAPIAREHDDGTVWTPPVVALADQVDHVMGLEWE